MIMLKAALHIKYVNNFVLKQYNISLGYYY